VIEDSDDAFSITSSDLEETDAINAADARGQTLLFYASMHGNRPLAEELLKCNADVHVADANGWTALHAIVKYDRDVIVQLLLEHGASARQSATQSGPVQHWKANSLAPSDNTPMHLAVCCRHEHGPPTVCACSLNTERIPTRSVDTSLRM
jgi:ankyrin repeat protein